MPVKLTFIEIRKEKKKLIYELLSLPSASLPSSGPDIIFRSPDLVITAVICKTVKSTDTELFNETERHFNVSLLTFSEALN